MSLHSKFNLALDDAALKNDFLIINLEVLQSENQFDRLGQLNTLGKFTFKKEINMLLQEFDKCKVSLMP